MTSDTETATRQVGLFGGSFNPPHVCHALATLWAMQTHALDEVWWIPTYQHAFAKTLATYEHRRAMCALATAPLRGVHICDIEQELGGESRTIDTVRVLRERHPNTRFSLIVGADILTETHRWKQWDELMTMVRLIVVGRGEPGGREDHALADLRLPDVSSTAIRDALERCAYDELKPWVGREVLNYIARHQLYVDDACARCLEEQTRPQADGGGADS